MSNDNAIDDIMLQIKIDLIIAVGCKATQDTPSFIIKESSHDLEYQ